MPANTDVSITYKNIIFFTVIVISDAEITYTYDRIK